MKILIVVDMQNDFITGTLANTSLRIASVIENVRKKVEAYRGGGGRVIFTYDTHDADYLQTLEGRHLSVAHCIKGSEGWQIIPELTVRDGDIRLYKPTFGSPDWAGVFAQIPDEITQIELCGVCTDICVISNALIIKAIKGGTEVVVDASCCAGLTEERHEAALLVMDSCQIGVWNR